MHVLLQEEQLISMRRGEQITSRSFQIITAFDFIISSREWKFFALLLFMATCQLTMLALALVLHVQGITHVLNFYLAVLACYIHTISPKSGPSNILQHLWAERN